MSTPVANLPAWSPSCGASAGRLRILYVTPYVPSPIRVRPFQLLRALSAEHDVTLLAAVSGSERAFVGSLSGYPIRAELARLRPLERVAGCLGAAWRGEPLQAGACWSRQLAATLERLMATGAFDVAHVEHLRAGYVVQQLAGRLPVVFDAVDSLTLLHERTRRSSHSVRQRAIARVELPHTRRFEVRLAGLADRVCVTSADDVAAFEQIGAPDVAVVPNGVDTEYFRPPGRVAGEPWIVFSGKMSYHANVTAALRFAREIFPLVRRRVPRARLRIVGSSPAPEVRALARDPAIVVTGYLKDLRAAVGTASVAVCPVAVKVGVQNKILEAMALGLPVVSTSLGAIGLQAEPGRELLLADTDEAFAEQVCDLLEQPRLRASLARAGRHYVESQHRWSVSANRLVGLYYEARERWSRPTERRERADARPRETLAVR